MLEPRAFHPSVIRRFESKITQGDGGCWLWTAGKSHNGYGEIAVFGRTMKAHRWSYEYHVALIPDGLVIDHLCRIRACCNPWHLEPVTGLVNAARGDNAMRTACIHGHPYTEENTAWEPQRARPDRMKRECRECVRQATRRYRANRKLKNG